VIFGVIGAWTSEAELAHIIRRNIRFSGLMVAAVLSVAGMSRPALAADLDPAVVRVQTLDDTLVSASKKGDLKSPRVRAAVDQAFNLQVMAQIAVGAPWATMSAAERASVVDALSRYTAARFAHEFNDFSGQSIKVDPTVMVRGVDKLVRAEVHEQGEPPLKIGYRMRDYPGGPKIIDVIYNGISQLATQRADFADAIATGGAAGLVKKLDAATAKLK
jgi:phospholipid transport system substrate-binding protein